MSKPTLILIIILFFIAGGLLALALNKSSYNPTQNSRLPIPSVNPVIPETSLMFGSLDIASPSSYPRIYSLPILINTKTNKVTAVQLELSFDPDILTNVNIKPSAFFKNPNVVINKINTETGRISYVLIESDSIAVKTASESANPAQRGKQGNGPIAILNFESKISSVSSTITFLPRTFVTADGLGQSALISTNSAMLNIQPKLGN